VLSRKNNWRKPKEASTVSNPGGEADSSYMETDSYMVCFTAVALKRTASALQLLCLFSRWMAASPVSLLQENQAAHSKATCNPSTSFAVA
jgi:hypothetical protein